MNLVDSCGWLEYFTGGPNAGFYSAPLQRLERLVVPTICILEVYKRVTQQRGEDAALQAVALMHQGIVVDLDAALAITVAKISGGLRLPLADSVVLATAREYGAVIWTQDSDFAGMPGGNYKKKK